jgi:hypothetical protein
MYSDFPVSRKLSVNVFVHETTGLDSVTSYFAPKIYILELSLNENATACHTPSMHRN